MAFVNISEKVEFSPEKLRKVGLFESERMLFDVYCLLPGQAQKTHVHDDMDKVYVGLSGSAIAIVGQEERALQAGEAAVAPAGVAHGLRNDGPGAATVIVFQARQKR